MDMAAGLSLIWPDTPPKAGAAILPMLEGQAGSEFLLIFLDKEETVAERASTPSEPETDSQKITDQTDMVILPDMARGILSILPVAQRPPADMAKCLDLSAGTSSNAPTPELPPTAAETSPLQNLPFANPSAEAAQPERHEAFSAVPTQSDAAPVLVPTAPEESAPDGVRPEPLAVNADQSTAASQQRKIPPAAGHDVIEATSVA
ncbi:MAG: hypothetical protein ORN49_04380, partial [Rhodobacteraceae bacterium]|nr:hypothetical protein [Paracoccaceae bacterium]